MFIKTQYSAWAAQETRNEEHNMEAEICFIARDIKSTESYENIKFIGTGKTRKEAYEKLNSFLLGAKKDIETAIKEAKAI